jgi:DNA-directed RNA polymerase specialized sigma24 family protein
MDPLDRYARLKDRSDIALIKDVSYGNLEAFDELMNRYLDLVSRTSFRILCDRRDSEYVTARVFVSLWCDVLDYDDRFTVGEWLLRKTCINARLRIMRRRILRIFGVINDVFVNVSPVAADEDDYVTKQAWELHCRAVSHMTPLQAAVYALCVLEDMSVEEVAFITGLTRFRIGLASERAEDKVRNRLKDYDKEADYERYNGFLRKVSDSLTDYGRLRHEILLQLGIK